MEPAIVTGFLAVLFVGTHIGLATGGVRASLVMRLGERGFRTVFSVIASLTFAALVSYYARHRFSGLPGLALGNVPMLRWPLIATVVLGVALTSAGATSYVGSPYDMFSHRVRPPLGVERIARHPFFVGVALFAIAHALLATHLVGAVNFSALALLSSVGARFQDRKLLTRAGAAYQEYLDETSMIPFAAVASGRQTVVWRELPITAFVTGLLIAGALRAVHDQIFAYGGVYVIAGVIGGAGVLGFLSSRHADRRPAARVAAQANPSSA